MTLVIVLLFVLISMIFILLGVALLFLYRKNAELVNMLATFKPTEIHIGKIPEFTQEQEDFLANNKDFLTTLIAYLDKRLDISNGALHDRSLGDRDIQFVRGQCDTYIMIRGQMNTLLKRKKKNDN